MERILAKLIIAVIPYVLVIFVIMWIVETIFGQPLYLYLGCLVFPSIIVLLILLGSSSEGTRRTTKPSKLKIWSIFCLSLIIIGGCPAIYTIANQKPDLLESGEIELGNSYRDDDTSFKVIGKSSRFNRMTEIAYVTKLSALVPSKNIDRAIFRVQEDGTLILIDKKNIKLSGESYIIIAGVFDVSDLTTNQSQWVGQFIIRFMSQNEVLSEGKFMIK